MVRKPIKRVVRRKPSGQRLKLKISKGLDLLRESPEATFTLGEKDILRRIQKKVSDSVYDTRLTQADYVNMKKIAAKRGMKLP